MLHPNGRVSSFSLLKFWVVLRVHKQISKQTKTTFAVLNRTAQRTRTPLSLFSLSPVVDGCIGGGAKPARPCIQAFLLSLLSFGAEAVVEFLWFGKWKTRMNGTAGWEWEFGGRAQG